MRITCPRRRIGHACAFILTIAMHPTSANAQSLSCNGSLAGVGESRASVLQKCGEPMVRDTVCMPGRSHDLYVAGPGNGLIRVPVVPTCVPTEEWTYHRGSGNFLGVVRFGNGVVESVRDGERMR